VPGTQLSVSRSCVAQEEHARKDMFLVAFQFIKTEIPPNRERISCECATKLRLVSAVAVSFLIYLFFENYSHCPESGRSLNQNYDSC